MPIFVNCEVNYCLLVILSAETCMSRFRFLHVQKSEENVKISKTPAKY